MRVKTFILSTLLLLNLEGALIVVPQNQSGSSSPNNQNPLDSVRHRVNNHEQEVRIFANRLENLQIIVESLQDQLQTNADTHKEQLKGSVTALEVKMAAVESSVRGLTADLQQLKTHANETTTALQGYKKTLIDYDHRLQAQSQSIENLSSALQIVLDSLNIKTELPSAIEESSEKTYKIKSGDRLDKIAKTHGTTVRELMRLNNMTSDKIVEGKNLKLRD